jgi:hypothetical protein
MKSYFTFNFALTVYQRCVRKEERSRRERKVNRGEGEGTFILSEKKERDFLYKVRRRPPW